MLGILPNDASFGGKEAAGFPPSIFRIIAVGVFRAVPLVCIVC